MGSSCSKPAASSAAAPGPVLPVPKPRSQEQSAAPAAARQAQTKDAVSKTTPGAPGPVKDPQPQQQDALEAKVHAGKDRHSKEHGTETIPAVPSPVSQSAQHDTLEAKVRAAHDQLSQDGDTEATSQHAGSALAALDSKLQQLSRAASSSMEDVEDPPLTAAEEALLQYSVLGQVLVDAGGALIESLPFGSTVAALMSAIYTTALRAAKNRRNCNELVAQLRRCDKQLARVALKLGSQAATLPPDTLQGMCDLAKVIQQAATIIRQYSETGCIMLFITSQGYQKQFQQLQDQLQRALGWTSFAFAMDTLAGAYEDEAAGLRQAICQAAGGMADVEQAVQHLQATQPGELLVLLKQHGSFSDSIIAQELQHLGATVAAHGQTLLQHGRQLSHVSRRIADLEKRSKQQQNGGPDSLAQYLHDWWDSTIGEFKGSAPWPQVRQAFIQEAAPAIQQCGVQLAQEAQTQGWPLPAGTAPGDVFLDCVVLQLLDEDKNSIITLSELKGLQERSLAFTASHKLMRAPAALGQLLKCTLECTLQCERTLLRNTLAPPDALTVVQDMLQASAIIQSYSTAPLLDNYLSGTRTWLFDDILAWHTSARQQRPGSSRMFLLLAEAGMGKSVCSAVLLKHLAAAKQQSPIITAHHFFKVGQKRGEGKAMIKCLVQQLCEQLPDLASIVQEVLKQLPALDSLSMAELLDKLLLGPLTQLDQQLQQKPSCLLLLDALDESTDNNQGWKPVCNLVAAQFQRLPPWVCVLVTGRPEVESRFASWQPATWIAAEDEHNLRDLEELLLAKLRLSKLVEDSQVVAAAQLLRDKSQGRFIYAKYVFNILVEQPHWSLEQLQQLPDGLTQMYCYQLDTIHTALHAERPELVALLQARLLPLLAVMKEALPTELLVWLTGGRADDVGLLLHLLYSLFPSRPGPDGTTVVAPYHKSIQDFLLLKPGQTPAPAAQQQWRTAAAEAHRVFVARLLPELQTAQLHHWQDQCAPQVLPDLPAGQQYCLQYLVDHIALAQDWAALHQLLRHLPGLKAVLEVPGQVYKLIRVVADAAAGCQEADWQQHFQSVQRFLRASCHVINTDPDSILQDIVCSPRGCVLGDWCEQDYHVRQALPGSSQQEGAVAMWRGACLVTARAEHFPVQVATLQGHTDEVTCCAISPDGRLLVSGSWDGTLKVWDLATGELRTTLQGNFTVVFCCVIDPDGQLLVSGSDDKTLKVWDLATGQLRTMLEGHTADVTCCAISPDGQTLVSGSDDTTLKVWDLATRELRTTWQGHTEPVTCCAISPDGQLLVSGSRDGTLKVWDLATGQPCTTLEWDEYGVCCAISPDGQLLVYGSKDKILKVWDLAAGQPHTTLQGHTREVTCCAISPDGQLLVPDGNTLKVWDLATGQLRTTLEGHRAHTLRGCCAVSRDGQLLVSSCEDYTLLVLDLRAASQAEGCAAVVQSHVKCCDISRDCQLLVFGCEDDTLQVWDLATGQLRTTLQQHTQDKVTCCALSPDGQLLVFGLGNNTFKVWDLATGQVRTTLEGHKYGRVSCCTISPDGQVLVSGSDYGLLVWDLATGQQRTNWLGAGLLTCCAISPDGQLLVSGSERDGELKVWDVATGKPRITLTGHTGRTTCCAISPDGQTLVTGSTDYTLQVWDLATGQLRTTLEGHADAVSCCAISPDGQLLVSGCASLVYRSDDLTLKVWDLATGQLQGTLHEHNEQVTCCSIGGDGQVVLGFKNKAVKVYTGNWQQGGTVPSSSLFTPFGKCVRYYVF